MLSTTTPFVRNLILTFSALSLAACASGTVTPELQPGTPGDAGLSASVLDEIVPAMQAMVDKGNIPGTVTAVVRHGSIVHLEATGYQDASTKVPMEVDSLFRIYSMSKPISAVALMTMWEEGLFQLDDPVSKYIPELGGLTVWSKGGDPVPSENDMTVRDLLRHTSGLGYGFLSGNREFDRIYTELDLLNQDSNTRVMVGKLGQLPLLYEPGTNWAYSVSSDVVALLGEVLTGKTFDVILQERIFGPLAMTDTGYFVPDGQSHRLVTNHDGRCRTFEDSEGALGHVPTMRAGGMGLVSSASDYLRFAQMLLNGGTFEGARILHPETVTMITSNQLPDGVKTIRFGGWPVPNTAFGFGMSVDIGKGPKSGEFGWGGAASTTFWVSPSRKLIGVCMSQQMPMNMVPGGVMGGIIERAYLPSDSTD
jgi:CubicO group peptidase (beta-lactamase class C family)